MKYPEESVRAVYRNPLSLCPAGGLGSLTHHHHVNAKKYGFGQPVDVVHKTTQCKRRS